MGKRRMQVIRSILDLKTVRKTLKGTVGFVPTMGYLHDGHLRLIEFARAENDFVIISIFVNPKQFNEKSDFNAYPVDEKRDLEQLKKAAPDVVFMPSVRDMYPEGFDTAVSVGQITSVLEGGSRPAHFTGVTTVIAKLLLLTSPDTLYLGQKDAQQVVVIKRMVKDLCFPVEIIVCNTVREKDGLAKSSRNALLTPVSRIQASVLYKALTQAEKLLHAGVKNPETIKKTIKDLISKTSGHLDYVSIADPETLVEVKTVDKRVLISLAVIFGSVRLIDNLIIDPKQ